MDGPKDLKFGTNTIGTRTGFGVHSQPVLSELGTRKMGIK